MRLFRIGQKNLHRLWVWTGVPALLLFLVLLALDRILKSRTGFGTSDLQLLSTATQYQVIHAIWSRGDAALRAGFLLGLDYLLIPLYAAALFCSGLVVQEYYVIRRGLVRRVVAVATLVPLLAGLLDATENALEIYLLSHPGDLLAEIAFRVSHAKMVCIYVGIALLLAALFGWRMRMHQKKLNLEADEL